MKKYGDVTYSSRGFAFLSTMYGGVLVIWVCVTVVLVCPFKLYVRHSLCCILHFKGLICVLLSFRYGEIKREEVDKKDEIATLVR